MLERPYGPHGAEDEENEPWENENGLPDFPVAPIPPEEPYGLPFPEESR